MWIQVLGLSSLGDSFLIRDAGGDLRLVDGGRSSDEVVNRLLAANVESLHSVVCTHCDEDHIGGVKQVLLRLKVSELWLPGSWGDVLVGAVKCVDGQRRELLQTQLDETQLVGSEADPVEQWADEASTYFQENLREDWHRTDGPFETDLDLLSEGVARLSDDSEMDARLRKRLRALVSIVQAAIDRKVRIRFFSYESAESLRGGDLWLTSGDPHCLTILNAREVAVDLCPDIPVALMFRLTIQNRRALVPLAHGWYPEGGALLCSDSSFEFLGHYPIPWSRVALVAAPHHGSDNPVHAPLYRSAENADFVGHWVRSHNDTTYPTWPGQEWLARDPRSRFCTRCRGDASARVPPQDLLFVPEMLWHPGWRHPVGMARPCRCA